ncbi:MAG TPA: hypothetical protein ENF64_01305 [Hadesarchaea archaeon]|nr:hypothetical protein [Hadesarchaea archaeon]
MPSAKFILKLGGAFLIGTVTIIIAALVFVLALPHILPVLESVATGALLVLLGILVFIALWAAIYLLASLGVAIYYAVKHPMKVSEAPKHYSLSQASEAGRRRKGKVRPRRS